MPISLSAITLCSAQCGLAFLSHLQHIVVLRGFASRQIFRTAAPGRANTGETIMADAAETMKKTADQAAAATASAGARVKAQAETLQAAGTQAFREGIDKSVASLGELNAHGKKNLDAMVESATVAQKGAEALSQQALGFAKTSWEDGVAASKELSTARSVQEFFELQTAWAKKSMERYVAEMTKTNEIVAATVKDSLKPLNERVTASVESFQAAR